MTTSQTTGGTGPAAPQRWTVTGHFAGPVSRAAAAAIDVIVVMAVYTVVYATIELLADALFDRALDGRDTGRWAAVTLASWCFLYLFVGLAVSGRTVGKAVVGLRVLCADGSTLTVGRAFVRVLALPVSILLAIGLVTVVLDREHRALHDFIAGTVVVYDWGGRSARLSGPLADFLARRGSGSGEGEGVGG